MDTIFMNAENSKTSDTHRLLLKLSDKTNLGRNDKYVALSNVNIYYTWKNIKKPYKNNKFEISPWKLTIQAKVLKSHTKIINSTWNEEFELH